MHTFLALLFLFAPPFWEARQPPEWADSEVDQMLHNSPWAQKAGPEPSVRIFLASARPIREAEAELRIRGREVVPDPDPDYLEYAARNADSQVILAVEYQRAGVSWPVEEERRLKDQCVMVAGRRKHHMIGYFPPTSDDPVLRIAFPRDAQPTDKRILFRLYLPGITFPEREAEFDVKQLFYHGKLEM